MPYFERKTYDETLAAMHSGPAARRTADDVPVVDLAQSILADETGADAGVDGPFRAASPVAPGQSARIVLGFAAQAQTDAAATLVLQAGDLTDGTRAVIPARDVTLTPDRVVIETGQGADVTVTIHTGKLTKPGLYRGRIDVTGAETFKIAIEVEVSGQD